MKNTILFSNEFCTIVETPKGVWVREDEILHTAMEVDCYFDTKGVLIRK